MSTLRGGGVIETFCPACGFGMRQSYARPVRQSRSRWYAPLDAVRTFALPVSNTRPGSRFRLLSLAAWALLAVAVRALFVGYPSIEPIVFAELYVLLFSSVALLVTFVKTAKHFSGKQILILLIGALAGVLLVVKVVKGLNAIPASWEPDYCADLNYPSGGVDFRLPPKTFRCISIPIVLAGAFLGWWLTYWLINRWQRSHANR